MTGQAGIGCGRREGTADLGRHRRFAAVFARCLLVSAAVAPLEALAAGTDGDGAVAPAWSFGLEASVWVLAAMVSLLLPACIWLAVRLLGSRADTGAVLDEPARPPDYRSVLDATVDGVLIGTPDGLVTDANPSALEILGRAREAIVGMPVSDLFPPEVLAENPLRFDLLSAGEAIVNEREIRRLDGTRVKIEMRSRRMAGGHCYSLIRDITEQRRTEAELRRRTAELEEFFDSSLDLLCIADTQGRFVRVNREWERVLGYSMHELEHQFFLDFVHPDDLPATEAAVARLARQEEIVSFTNRYRCLDGSYRDIEWRSTPRGELIYAAARDVTERNRTEEALRRTQFAVDRASEGVLWVDADGMVIYANDAVCASLGYSHEELLGMRVFDFDPDVKEEEMPAHREALRRERSWVFESRHVAKDGRVFPVEVSTNYMEFDGQWFSCCFVRDISDRKAAEAALRRTQFTVDRLSDSVIWADRTGQVLYVNDAACSSLGYSREELLRMHVFDFDVDFDQEAMARQRAQLRESGSVVFESRQITKDGRVFPVEVSNNLVEFDGEAFACAFIRDISERKEAEAALRQSEATFRAIIEASPMGVHLYELQDDGNLVFTGANPAADRLLGVQHDQFVGMVIEEAFPALRDTEIPERYRQVAMSGQSWRTERIDYQDGKVAGAFEVYVFRMSPGKVAVGLLDIADRLRAAAEKEALQDQLHQAQKLESVGRLAGGVAHDFNNMLQAIQGYAELALEEVAPGSRLENDIEEIQKAAEHSAYLTKQLLAFARRQTAMPKVIDLNETVADALGMLQRLIGEEVRLSWVPEAGLWPVKLDPSQVSMVLANLCVNSRDAIEGMGCITIESRNETVDEADCAKYPDAVAGDYVTLVVSDDGCGMAPEVLAHVFDPFFTTKDVDKGTGLGLATVHGIALQNGGFVDISSEPGQGTVLRVHFPRHRSAPPAPKHVEPRAAVEGGGETVLVVEDEPALLRMCGETLRRLGYRVLLAGLPGEAVELADRPGERIDLLITDVVMPHMSGPALAARLSARHSDLVCLYMSGYSEDVISQHGIVEEGLNFIPKPFPRKALAEKVRQALVRE